MNQNRSHDDISDWKLERFLLGELDDQEMERIQRTAGSDESLRTRLEKLKRSNREIHEKYPPGWMSQRIRDKCEAAGAPPAKTRRKSRLRNPRLILFPAGVLVVAALAMFVLPNLLPTGGPSDLEVTRLKGPGHQLRLYRQTDGGSQLLKDGDSAAQHDLILLQYQAVDDTYGAILSVDGRGMITTHLPARGNWAVEFEPERSHFLDFAYELDDAPRWEIFFFATSRSPFQIAGISRVLEKSPLVNQPEGIPTLDKNLLEFLDFPDGVHVSTFILIKDSRHEN